MGDLFAWRGRFGHRYRATWLLILAVLAFTLAPWPLYDKLWTVAASICPQRPGHSLFFGGVQMPIEAREGGIFIGFLVGLLYLLALGRGKTRKLPERKLLLTLLIFVGLMGLDGLNAVAYDLYLPTPYEPNLTLRLGTGLMAGLAIATLLLPIFNQTMWTWENSSPAASMAGWKELAGGLLLIAFIWAIGLSGLPLLLYPISSIAIAGQILLFAGLGTMIAAGLLRREGQVRSFGDLSRYLLLGLLGVAIFMSAAVLFRYSLFGPGSLPTLR